MGESKKKYVFTNPREIPANATKGQAHMIKCKNRTCSVLGVTEEHIDEALGVLNGRRVDGFLVEDIIGRFGYFDGMCVNRPDLANKYGRKVRALEIATDRLKEILNNADVKKAYKNYTEGIKAVEGNKLDNHANTGDLLIES